VRKDLSATTQVILIRLDAHRGQRGVYLTRLHTYDFEAFVSQTELQVLAHYAGLKADPFDRMRKACKAFCNIADFAR
jgi:hypothetical protein